MRGKMAWFNEEKGHGYITTDAGERIYVSQDGFAEGNAPKGRCAGLEVEFDVTENGEGRQAVRSVLVDDASPQRARRRYRAGH
jgi:cold shock CspA family protein